MDSEERPKSWQPSWEPDLHNFAASQSHGTHYIDPTQTTIVSAGDISNGHVAGEKDPLLGKDNNKEFGDENVIIYTRRWYILLLYSMLAFMQGGVWNTWGPITKSAELVFNWDDADIALLSNWGPITFVISTFFFTWLMDVKGLRWSCLITAALVSGGSALRCITSDPKTATWFIHAGHILNGFAGPVAMSACTLLSSTWFPSSERTTVTALASAFICAGIGAPFIAGPLLVSDTNFPVNLTTINVTYNSSASAINEFNVTNTSGDILPYVEDIRGQIMRLMYYEAGLAGLIFLLMIVYFPSKPPTPPSISASKERVDYKKGLIGLFKHKKFWLVALPYGVSTGVYGVWGSVLDVNLKDVVDESEAGWLGFWATMAGAVAGLGIARFADVFAGHMKKLLLLLIFGACASFAWFALLLDNVIPLTTTMLYASCILGGIFVNGSIPLFYEISCEVSYPIAEGVTTGLLTLLNNTFGLIFLLVFLKPNVGTMWMNWFLLGSVIFCIPFLLVFREKYTRLELDTHKHYGDSDPIND